MSASLVEELMVNLAHPDRRLAAQRCIALIESGMPLVDLVDKGLAPAMSQVGAMWEASTWSVTDEHLATAVAEAALSAASAECRPGPPRGDVVVACVEGDWHSLPSRMLAEVLDSEGWRVRFLGASQPTALLVEHLGRYRPDAVMLSCAIPMALPELAAAAQLIHELGLRVYAGGRALGSTPRRALLLGADGWAENAAGALRLLEQPTTGDRADAPEAQLADYRAREALLPGWVAAAMKALESTMPAVAAYPEHIRERTAADLHHLLEVAALSLLVDDPQLLDEQCRWLQGLLDARHVPSSALTRGLEALTASRPADPLTEDVADALQLALTHLGSTDATLIR